MVNAKAKLYNAEYVAAQVVAGVDLTLRELEQGEHDALQVYILTNRLGARRRAHHALDTIRSVFVAPAAKGLDL